MATVYLARDLRHARYVAIKMLRPELATAIGGTRFLEEIRTTAGLQHPHIVPLHDSGEALGTVHYVMPFIAGESLRARLAPDGSLVLVRSEPPVGAGTRLLLGWDPAAWLSPAGAAR